jgi:hypothetical protein
MRTGLGSTLVLASVLFGAAWGCGSDAGSSGDASQAIQDCKDICKKEVSCTPQLTLDCDKLCTPSSSGAPSGSAGSSSTASCDYAAYHSKVQECSKVDCSTLTTCVEDLAKTCGG